MPKTPASKPKAEKAQNESAPADPIVYPYAVKHNGKYYKPNTPIQ